MRMTEKEKMLAGELYVASDPQLVAERRRARDLLHALNASRAGETEVRASILRELLGAAGGVVSTVTDLARFDVALDAGRLISDASKAEMWRPGRSTSGEVLPYGIGWYVEQVDGRRLVWHTGLWEKQYSALYVKLPDERLTLILLANSEGLWWGKPLDAAQVDRSPFAAAFLRRFRGR